MGNYLWGLSKSPCLGANASWYYKFAGIDGSVSIFFWVHTSFKLKRGFTYVASLKCYHQKVFYLILLSDTKLAENVFQQIIRSYLTSDLAEGIEGAADIGG